MADLKVEDRLLQLLEAGDTLEMVRGFMDLVPFNKVLGLEVRAISEGYCEMFLPFRDELIGDPIRPALHGGVLSSLIDTCGGATVWTMVELYDRVSTVDLRVDYLRPGLAEDLIVEGHIVRIGNRVGVADMIAYHPGKKDEPVATGKGVYNVKRAER